MKSLSIKLVLFFLLSISNITAGLASTEPLPEGEYFVLHVNKSFFVTGETVWYSLYTPNALKGVAFTMNVQVTTWNGAIKEHYFLKTEGEKQVDGYLKIPFDWTSGFYTLTFSGIDEATKARVQLAKIDLPVYNDLEKLPKGIQVETIENSGENKINGSKGALKIQLNKSTFVQGENVEATVSVMGANGKPVKANLSVSVIDDKLGGDHLLNNQSVHTFYDTKLPTAALSNDLYAFGQLANEDKSPLFASIVGAFSPLENKVHYLRTNEQGNYALKLPEFYGEKPLQILLYKSQEKFQVNEERTVAVPAGMKPAPLVYTDEILEYIKQSRSRKKINQFYGGVENNLKTTPVSIERSKLKPGLTYKMSEYETFENVGEFFIEVITPLKFKINKDNTFTASIVNPRQYTSGTKKLDGDPLYILDGKVTKNADFVGKLKTSQIDEVKLHYNPNKLNDHYRAIAVGGIAEFTTTEDDFHIPLEEENDIFMAKGIQSEGVFESGVASDGIPIFKSQVYWNPMIGTNNKGNAKVNFTQSDDVSTFVIKVVAQTSTGDMIYGEQTYEVKRAN